MITSYTGNRATFYMQKHVFSRFYLFILRAKCLHIFVACECWCCMIVHSDNNDTKGSMERCQFRKTFAHLRIVAVMSIRSGPEFWGELDHLIGMRNVTPRFFMGLHFLKGLKVVLTSSSYYVMVTTGKIYHQSLRCAWTIFVSLQHPPRRDGELGMQLERLMSIMSSISSMLVYYIAFRTCMGHVKRVVGWCFNFF